MKKQWFYTAQKSVRKFLKESFEKHICLAQDVCHDVVYESYQCIRGDSTTILMAEMKKSPVESAPGVINIYTQITFLTYEQGKE